MCKRSWKGIACCIVLVVPILGDAQATARPLNDSYNSRADEERQQREREAYTRRLQEQERLRSNEAERQRQRADQLRRQQDAEQQRRDAEIRQQARELGQRQNELRAAEQRRRVQDDLQDRLNRTQAEMAARQQAINGFGDAATGILNGVRDILEQSERNKREEQARRDAQQEREEQAQREREEREAQEAAGRRTRQEQLMKDLESSFDLANAPPAGDVQLDEVAQFRLCRSTTEAALANPALCARLTTKYSEQQITFEDVPKSPAAKQDRVTVASEVRPGGGRSVEFNLDEPEKSAGERGPETTVQAAEATSADGRFQATPVLGGSAVEHASGRAVARDDERPISGGFIVESLRAGGKPPVETLLDDVRAPMGDTVNELIDAAAERDPVERGYKLVSAREPNEEAKRSLNVLRSGFRTNRRCVEDLNGVNSCDPDTYERLVMQDLAEPYVRPWKARFDRARDGYENVVAAYGRAKEWANAQPMTAEVRAAADKLGEWNHGVYKYFGAFGKDDPMGE